MFWFSQTDDRAVFCDVRRGKWEVPDVSSSGGVREITVDPDIIADFRSLPFESGTFDHVVFDPPHFRRNGKKSWCGLKYGTLGDDWEDMLTSGFSECFRVLRPGGTLIFKWCSTEISVCEVLKCTNEKPLYGHKSGKRSETHWIAFLKGSEE